MCALYDRQVLFVKCGVGFHYALQEKISGEQPRCEAYRSGKENTKISGWQEQLEHGSTSKWLRGCIVERPNRVTTALCNPEQTMGPLVPVLTLLGHCNPFFSWSPRLNFSVWMRGDTL
jgi:hypothetical protein